MNKLNIKPHKIQLFCKISITMVTSKQITSWLWRPLSPVFVYIWYYCCWRAENNFTILKGKWCRKSEWALTALLMSYTFVLHPVPMSALFCEVITQYYTISYKQTNCWLIISPYRVSANKYSERVIKHHTDM